MPGFDDFFDNIQDTVCGSVDKPIAVPDVRNNPQCRAVECEADELFYGGGAGGGKMLSLDTPIPTLTGWTTMGEVRAGDVVFDERGSTCVVTHAHPVNLTPKSYRVTFDDGSCIDACADHQWLTYDAKELKALTRLSPESRQRRRESRPLRCGGNKSATFTAALRERNATRSYNYKPAPTGSVRTTQEIFDTLRTPQGRANHAVPVAGALKLIERHLPLDPYCLGAWLGDGSKMNGQFTGIDPEIWQQFEAAGFKVSHSANRASAHHILGLKVVLRPMGVLQNKHIPAEYLRASYDQRLALLQGLMDTDGTVTDSGSVEFTNTNYGLVVAVHELICSLGWKARIVEGRATLNGKDCGPKYDIKWTPSDYVFRLSRKRDKQKLSVRRTTKFRYVVSCEPIESVPMRCITVDSPSHLYLAGRHMVPTHNSYLLLILAFTKHRRSLLLRRENVTTKDLIDKARTILDDSIGQDKYSYNQNLGIFRGIPGDRVVEVAGCEKDTDKEKYKGREHDLKCFDELSDFTKEQYEYICQWNRSSIVGQRSRIVATGNPPTTDEGQWVIERWRCWIDDEYEGSPIKVIRVDDDGFGHIEDAFGTAAKDGELRWFVKVGGVECECPDGVPFNWRRTFINDQGDSEDEIELTYPTSRSFIAARVIDNRFLGKEYIARLQALDEPLRSMFLYGKWVKFREDDANKIIPYSWVKAAMDRWESMRPDADDMQHIDCLGVDPAAGGEDDAAFAMRYGNWFDHVITRPGKKMKDGPAHAKAIEELLQGKNCASVNIDAISWGQSTFDILKVSEEMVVSGINITKPSRYRDKSKLFKCADLKSEIHWRFREALDPEADEPIALPPDPELLNDLAAPTYEVQMGGIKVESKKALRKRLGRSPGKGDAILLAYYRKVVRSLEAS